MPSNRQIAAAQKAAWYRRPEVQARRKARSQTPAFKERSRKALAKYRNSERGRRQMQEYRSRPEVKARHKEMDRLSRYAPHRKAHRARYNAQYAKTPNGKIAHRRKYLKRRAVKAGAPLGDLLIIDQWMTKWKSKKLVKCYYCQNKYPPAECDMDHIVSLARGGSHSIENVCIACDHCNSSKHALDLATWNGRIASPVLL